MVYYAVVSWIHCMNGTRLPMEIAFASVKDPQLVYILHMRMPQDVYFTIKDLASTKKWTEEQCCESVDNVRAQRIMKMERETWIPTLQAFAFYELGLGVSLKVSCEDQFHFFKNVCGFRNVQIQNIICGRQTFGCFHNHNRLVNFPCAAKAARTMAYYLHKVVYSTESATVMNVEILKKCKDEPVQEANASIVFKDKQQMENMEEIVERKVERMECVNESMQCKNELLENENKSVERVNEAAESNEMILDLSQPMETTDKTLYCMDEALENNDMFPSNNDSTPNDEILQMSNTLLDRDEISIMMPKQPLETIIEETPELMVQPPLPVESIDETPELMVQPPLSVEKIEEMPELMVQPPLPAESIDETPEQMVQPVMDIEITDEALDSVKISVTIFKQPLETIEETPDLMAEQPLTVEILMRCLR